MDEEGSPFHRVDGESGYAVNELNGDSAGGAADDGPSLPHRLGHSEPEPFPKRFLQNDSGCPLQGVYLQVGIGRSERFTNSERPEMKPGRILRKVWTMPLMS